VKIPSIVPKRSVSLRRYCLSVRGVFSETLPIVALDDSQNWPAFVPIHEVPTDLSEVSLSRRNVHSSIITAAHRMILNLADRRRLILQR